MIKNQASVVFFSGDANAGNVSKVEPLLGQCVSNICGVDDKVYGITQSFIYDIDKQKQIPISNIIDMSAGKKHVMALSSSGRIYTWGSGEYGELGHGSVQRQVKDPKQITHSAKFVSISCGNDHSAAVDEKGNMYAWGQNFDRQLGLYTKTENSLLPPNSSAHVENVMMVPKCLPFSLLNSIKVVSCGSRFTVAITNIGELWTWGAGESGQLGTGRCTNRDVPQCCISKSMFNQTFIDASCGYGHVIANTSSGQLYSWGLNAKGQLGMGDIMARKHPELVEGVASVAKVYADRHSSACIDSNGQLFTWGSGLHFRLMNNDDTSNIFLPTLVTTMSGDIVEKFAFASTKSLALVITRVLSLSPETGPQKFRTPLEITGCGLWASEQIVVKFLVNTDDDSGIPRSCLGTYVRENVIACKPPKLSELGLYSVTVSMNGTDFLKDVLTLDVCPEPICNGLVSPHLFNARVMTVHRADIIVEASQLGKMCFEEGVYIRLQDTVDPTKEAVVVKGYIETEEEKELRLFESDGDISPNDEPDSGVVRVICRDVDLAALFAMKGEKYSVISAQVSSTGRDFSEPSPEKCIAHYFNVFDIEPQCCPVEGQREILVHGSAIPPTNFKIEVVVGISQGVVGGVKSFLELKLPTRSDDDQKLCFTIPPAEDIFKKNNKPVPANTDFFVAQIGFRLPNGAPLQDAAFQFNYYREQPIQVHPRAIRTSGGTRLTITSSYIQFVSDEALISFIERSNNVEKSVKFSEFTEVSDEDGNVRFSIECVVPCLEGDDDSLMAEEEEKEVEKEPVDKVFVGLLMDGISRPIDSFLFQADLFDAVHIETPVSKAPAVIGSTITAMATGLVDSDVCIIRIRSGVSGEFIELEGELGGGLDSLVFVLPEEVRELFPSDNSKSGGYHIDVSIDGTTFDEMETPGFLIKHV